MYHQELKITGHDKESNCISDVVPVHKNWCILRKHFKIEKCSIFSKIYENKILGTLELKLEPLNSPYLMRVLSNQKISCFLDLHA